jgi:hypothetical protein
MRIGTVPLWCRRSDHAAFRRKGQAPPRTGTADVKILEKGLDPHVALQPTTG